MLHKPLAVSAIVLSAFVALTGLKRAIGGGEREREGPKKKVKLA